MQRLKRCVKYIFCLGCILAALWACGGSQDDPLSELNRLEQDVTEKVTTATDEGQQVINQKKEQLNAFFLKATEVIEGAAAGARTALEEKGTENSWYQAIGGVSLTFSALSLYRQ